MLFLDKLVRKGRYRENGEWKAFADYCPAFFADINETATAEIIKTMLKKELFGAKPAKPQTKQPPGPSKSIHKGDGHGGY